MNHSDQVKIIADQLIGQGNLKIVDTVFSIDYVAHSGEKTHHGHQFVKQFAKQIRKAIPDIKILKIEILSQTDNIITWQRTLSGTHKSNLKGIPPSNKKIKWYELVVSRFDENKIIEEWVASDLAIQLILKLK